MCSSNASSLITEIYGSWGCLLIESWLPLFKLASVSSLVCFGLWTLSFLFWLSSWLISSPSSSIKRRFFCLERATRRLASAFWLAFELSESYYFFFACFLSFSSCAFLTTSVCWPSYMAPFSMPRLFLRAFTIISLSWLSIVWLQGCLFGFLS